MIWGLVIGLVVGANLGLLMLGLLIAHHGDPAHDRRRGP